MGNHMEQNRPYTIHFTYEIVEEFIQFPLQADVTAMADNAYFINNIRHAGKPGGALIPPFTLIKQNGNWMHADSKKETVLSLIAGRAIDNH
jgi:hypothetical protein